MKRACAALVLGAAVVASAQAPALVVVQEAWARPTVAGQDTGGAYMTLVAREPLTLLGASTPAAGVVEIHQMKMEGDVMRMRAADTLPLAPSQPLKLAPGGYHFMLMDLKAPLRAGSRMQMALRFRTARGEVRLQAVEVPVQVSAPRAHDRQ